jgi:antitoxin HicB
MARKPAPLAYPVQLDPEADGSALTVSFPDFFFERDGRHHSGGYSFGRSREEALAQAADLLETIVANHLAEGWDVPPPAPARGRPLVALAPLVAIKVELYRAMRAAGITKAELARRIGIAPQQVQRLFDTNHASRLDQLDAAFAALGRRLVVTSGAA